MVATQRRRVGQPVVRDENRLRAAQVGVGRHQGVARPLGLVEARRDEAHHQPLDGGDAPPDVEPQVERHLLVARPARVQALACVADAGDQLALDERVHVLVVAFDERGVRDRLVEQALQRAADDPRLFGPQHARVGEGLGPREAAHDIVFEQPPVEAERRAPGEDVGIGGSAEASRPQCAHADVLPRAPWGAPGAVRAEISAGSPTILMNPSAAAWSNVSPAP